jgi:hypothetical protein
VVCIIFVVVSAVSARQLSSTADLLEAERDRLRNAIAPAEQKRRDDLATGAAASRHCARWIAAVLGLFLVLAVVSILSGIVLCFVY